MRAHLPLYPLASNRLFARVKRVFLGMRGSFFAPRAADITQALELLPEKVSHTPVSFLLLHLLACVRLLVTDSLAFHGAMHYCILDATPHLGFPHLSVPFAPSFFHCSQACILARQHERRCC